MIDQLPVVGTQSERSDASPVASADGIATFADLLQGDSRSQFSQGLDHVDATARAQSQQRLADDDLERDDDQQDDPDQEATSTQHILQHGAVAVLLAELGLGRLSGVLGAKPQTPHLAIDKQLDNEQQLLAKTPEQTPVKKEAQQPRAHHSKVHTAIGGDSREGSAHGRQPSHPATVQTRSDDRMPAPNQVHSSSVKPAAVDKTLLAQGVRAQQQLIPNQDPKAKQPTQRADANVELRSAPAAAVRKASKPAAPQKTAQQNPMNDILQVLRSQVSAKQSTVKMQLSPPELGKLIIDMRLEDQVLQVKMTATNDGVKQMLVQNSSELTAALAQQGIVVEDLHIEVQEENETDLAEQTTGRESAAQHGGRDRSAVDGGSSQDSHEDHVDVEEMIDVDEASTIDIKA